MSVQRNSFKFPFVFDGREKMPKSIEAQMRTKWYGGVTWMRGFMLFLESTLLFFPFSLFHRSTGWAVG